MKQLTKLLLLIILSFVYAAQPTIEIAHLDHNWYPSESALLKTKISSLTKAAEATFSANLNSKAIQALIVPHASYNYSGTVAASVYRLCNPNIKKIIILAPAHTIAFTGIALPAFDTYQTPLGAVKVQTADIQKLATHKLFHINKTVYKKEHSLEIQLPLIQTFFHKDVTIVPLIVGKINCQQASLVAQAIKPLIDAQTLCLISTDFTHHGKHFNFEPFTEQVDLNIQKLDSQAVELIEAGKCAPFAEFIHKTGATICGANPLKILLALLETQAFGLVEPRFIAYDTSLRQANQKANASVSYIGMLFTTEKLSSVPFENKLTQQEQRALLTAANNLLTNLFDSKIDKDLWLPIKSFGLKQPYGAFTTLEKNTKTGKQLRGCIGRITSKQPLYQTTATVTQEAALADNRFKPVQKSELPNIKLKLSILSPLTAITNYRDIVIGKHGVVLENNGHSALFLPEVATEFNWSLTELLTQLSKKANLPSNTWKDPNTKFKVFTTIVTN